MPLTVATDLVNRLTMAVESSTRKTESSPIGNLEVPDAEIGRNLPAALAMILPAQHQHGQAVEGERPDDAEGVGLAQGDDVAPAGDDGEHLEDEDHVDDAIAGAELVVRLAEPVGQHAVLGHAHQHAGRADHRGVDGAGENQEADQHHEDAEGDAPEQGPHHVHGQAGDQVVLVDVGPFAMRESAWKPAAWRRR